MFSEIVVMTSKLSGSLLWQWPLKTCFTVRKITLWMGFKVALKRCKIEDYVITCHQRPCHWDRWSLVHSTFVAVRRSVKTESTIFYFWSHSLAFNWGIPSPDGIPYRFADFFFFFLFFFFLPPHFWWPFVVKKTTDWAEILHNHTYGHASGGGKKYFRRAHFPLSYVSKITQKNFRKS